MRGRIKQKKMGVDDISEINLEIFIIYYKYLGANIFR